MGRLRITCFTLVCLLWAAVGIAGTVYTWTGPDGVRHYSNSPPPEGVDNVQTADELQGDPAAGEAVRQEYDRMVEDAGQQADAYFADQAEEKARAEAAEKERQDAALAERVAAEREKLQAEIEAVQARALGPTFSLGQKEAMVNALLENLQRMERDPQAYFGN